MKAEIITNYQCPECSELHKKKYQAEECCPPCIEEVYICSVCDKEFGWEEDAAEHLATSHGNSKVLGTDQIYHEMLVFSDLHPVDALRMAEAAGTENELYTEPIFTR